MRIVDIVGNKKGFTLIEIAIVLVIVGLLVGMGATLIGPLTQRAKLHETRDVLNAAAESLRSYAASRNEVPEDTAAFSPVVRKSTDVWNRALLYALDTNLSDSKIGGICGRRSTSLTLRICSDAACSSPDTRNDVAFLILSRGANFNIQTDTTSATIDVYDVGITVDDFSGGGDPSNAVEYDDIYKWISLDELRIKAGCTGAQLTIVNNELPFVYQGSTYNATIFADGGVPFSSGGRYRWCRQSSVSTGLTFTPSTLSTDCLGDNESLWTQGDDLVISGTPSSPGSFSITFFVRDDNDSGVLSPNDNIAQKTMVLTVNPAPSAAGCADYRVWNNTGNIRDFFIDGTCVTTGNGSEITTPQMLNPGEDVVRRSTSNGNCGGSGQTLTYNEAVSADADSDCCVNTAGETGTDRACP
jgi:prepilin-type N-terminal cleavage/methylation domain-containing protein